MTEQQQQDALDQLSINTLRFLAVDQVQKANSGHPGAPAGLRSDCVPAVPQDHEVQPDRPVVGGPGPFLCCRTDMRRPLLYGVLHLTGYDLPMSQLQNVPANGDRIRRGIRSMARRRAWK